MNSKSFSSNPEEGRGKKTKKQQQKQTSPKKRPQKTKNKKANLSPNISMITLNLNGLNISIKRQRSVVDCKT